MTPIPIPGFSDPFSSLTHLLAAGVFFVFGVRLIVRSRGGALQTLSLVLYVVAGACWLPVVWMQYRMRDLAQAAADANTPLPAVYFRYLRAWVLLGIVAFAALTIVFYFMVTRPD